jgi:hypothetical protein
MRADVILIPFDAHQECQYDTLAQRKRATIWENRSRNRFVAQYADSFACNPVRALKTLGFENRGVQRLKRPNHQVVVLVENADHAWALAPELMLWSVFDTVPLREEESWQSPQTIGLSDSKRIVTMMYAYRYPVNCDILLRVSAGRGLLNWNLSSTEQLLSQQPKLILDIADQADRSDQVEVELRTQEYVKQRLRVRKMNAPVVKH